MECDYKRSNKLWIGDLTGFHPIGFQALTKPLFIGSDLLTEQYVFSLVLIVSAYCIVTVTRRWMSTPSRLGLETRLRDILLH